MERMARRMRGFGTTIFAEMTALAGQYNAINLGQGFPDFPAPDFIKEAAVQAVQADINQYAPSSGQPRLQAAVAGHIERHYGLAVDPAAAVTITHGATEGIFATIMGLVDPGDEVILFEPYYDSYLPTVEIAGGIPRYYTLRPPDWEIDRDELQALFSPRTKLIIINSPHNPTGKQFSAAELGIISDLCQEFDVLALADEVYEHILFDGRTHLPLAAVPGMAERTVTVSSLGKSFSVTGWKVGWTIAPPDLTTAVRRGHQFITFCGAAPLQEAAITALTAGDGYLRDLQERYQQKRDFLCDALTVAGLNPLKPAGTYFVMVDITELGFPDDITFCRQLTMEVGVTAIPPSAFYHQPADGGRLARFAFCKTDAALQKAAARLQTRL